MNDPEDNGPVWPPDGLRVRNTVSEQDEEEVEDCDEPVEEREIVVADACEVEWWTSLLEW